ncbi:MAG: tRNA (guanosine(37)-N1)-methyltransferase TrmD [Acidobacteriota bacterium]|jgi:tRNA (guanine37-N1)-methyltransferase|nr:tRNA (guanosine(37)-N1)-methyltransferase TrmD [Acidobacteriota bacterium]
MRIDILTIFPEFFTEVFDFGIIRRAKLAEIVEINVHDLRKWALDKHRKTDDRPFGGGDGMVMKCEPIFLAVEELIGTWKRENYPSKTKVIMLTPQGKPLKQAVANDFAEEDEHIVMICGRYEGIDERVTEALVTDEISIGDYVISGGEPAAIVLTDAIVRLLPNALGNEQSAENDSFSDGILDFPHYTQPRDFRGMEVPKILLGGHHDEIDKWREEKALEKTKKIRKDLLKEE